MKTTTDRQKRYALAVGLDYSHPVTMIGLRWGFRTDADFPTIMRSLEVLQSRSKRIEYIGSRTSADSVTTRFAITYRGTVLSYVEITDWSGASALVAPTHRHVVRFVEPEDVMPDASGIAGAI